MKDKKKKGIVIRINEPKICGVCQVIRKDGTVKYDPPIEENNEVKKG